MTSVDDILSPAVLARLDAPTADARGLPAAAYTSPEFFAREQAELFPNCWMSVAFDDDIGAVGDAIPITVCGQPIILVRAEDSVVRAFHNVCRHRATLVLTKPATGLSQFQCPYHAWTYDLTGALKATPFWDGTAKSERTPVDAGRNGLVPVACVVWNHVVFVNLSGSAEPFADYVAPFDAEYGHLNLAELRRGHRLSWEFKANWKLVMDNWEVYHHVWVHHGVFDKMSDEVDLETGQPYTDALAEGNVMMLKESSQRPRRGPSNVAGLPTLRSDGDRPLPAGTANAVLPNTTLTLSPTGYAPAIYAPVAPGVTRAEMAWYFVPEAAEADEYAAARKEVLDRWLGPSRRYNNRDGVRSQDHICMEWQQAARGSPVADDVKFSATWEQDVHYFQRWLVARLGRAPAPRG